MNQIDVLSLLTPGAVAPQAAQAGLATGLGPESSAEAFLSQLQLLLGANGPPANLAAKADAAPAGLRFADVLPGDRGQDTGNPVAPSLHWLAAQLAALIESGLSGDPPGIAGGEKPPGQARPAGPAKLAGTEEETKPAGSKEAAGLLAQLEKLRRLLPLLGPRLAAQAEAAGDKAVTASFSQIQARLLQPVQVTLPSGQSAADLAGKLQAGTAMALRSSAGAQDPGPEAQSILWLQQTLTASGDPATPPVAIPAIQPPARTVTLELPEGLRLTVDKLPPGVAPSQEEFLVTLQSATEDSPAISAKLTLSFLSAPEVRAVTAPPVGNPGESAEQPLPVLQTSPPIAESQANGQSLRPALSSEYWRIDAGSFSQLDGREASRPPAVATRLAVQSDAAGTAEARPGLRVSQTIKQVALMPAVLVSPAPADLKSVQPLVTTAASGGLAAEFARLRLQQPPTAANSPVTGKPAAVAVVKATAPATSPVQALPQGSPSEPDPQDPGAAVPKTSPAPTALTHPQPGVGDSQSSPLLPPQLLQFTVQLPQPDYSSALRSTLDRINTLVQHYKAAGDGLYNAQLELDPPALGKLFINVLVRGDNVAIQVAAVSPASREQLQAGAAQLRQGLIDSGLNVAEMRIVTLDPDDSESGPGHGGASQQQGQSGQGGQQGGKSTPRWEPPQKVASSA